MTRKRQKKVTFAFLSYNIVLFTSSAEVKYDGISIKTISSMPDVFFQRVSFDLHYWNDSQHHTNNIEKNYFHTSPHYLMVDKSSVWMHNLLGIQKNEVCLLRCNHEY